MELATLIDLVLHLDVYLAALTQDYGVLVYSILFLIIFCETGLVITPFLPGDSLVFAAGTLAALDMLNLWWILILLIIAAILGDALNYSIGKRCGSYLMRHPGLLKPKYFDRTRAFYIHHGGKTIVLARFMPILRTLAPFVAGIGNMSYKKFFAYNVSGAMLWIGLFGIGGFLFGNIPWVRDHFSLAVLVIIILSILPILNEVRRAHREKKHNASSALHVPRA